MRALPLARVLVALVLGTFTALAAEKPSYVAAPPEEPSLYALTIAAWADHPDYVAQLRSPAKSRAMPKVLQQVPPKLPPFMFDRQVNVVVSLVVDAMGNVEAARAVKSDDPRFNDSATAAVKQWKFAAADPAGDTRRLFSWAPISFKPAPSREIRIAVRPMGESMNRGMTLMPLPGQPASPPPPKSRIFNYSLNLEGPGAGDVRAARVRVRRAHDDLGTELRDETQPHFVNPSVGAISDEIFQHLPPVTPSFALEGPSPKTAATATIEGSVELVVPALDPRAVAVIRDVPSHFGTPIDSPELAAVGVKLVLRDHTAGPPPRGNSVLYVGPADLKDNDIVLEIDDPQERLVAVEFQTAAGAPVRYAHNGWFHSSDEGGKRFSVYRLEGGIGKDLRLVCWLATPTSIMTSPFKIERVPLVLSKPGPL